MNTRKLLKQLSILLILSLLLFTLTGCFDLGGFSKPESTGDVTNMSDHEFEEYYKDYYDTFSGVTLVNQNCKKSEFSIKKCFFNKQCVNEMRTWDTNEDCVPYNEYCYLVISFEKDIKLDSISLHFKAKDVEEDTNLYFYVFILKDFDTEGDYRTFDIWEKELEKEEDERRSASDYEDLNPEDAYDDRKISVNKNGWTSFTITFLEKGNSNYNNPYSFEKYDHIVLMFKNNLGMGLDDGLSKIKFTTTNLIARANDD